MATLTPPETVSLHDAALRTHFEALNRQSALLGFFALSLPDLAIAVADLDQNDRIVLFDGATFPYNACFLLAGRVVWSDMDGAATPAAVHDIDVVEADGTLVETIVSASTKMQGGGQDDLPNRVGLNLVNRRIEAEVTTAPGTKAAGTVDVYLAMFGALTVL
jgi:hypothetical protein